MSSTKKIAIGLGLATGALLAAWLLTGDRKKKTVEYIAKKAEDVKRALRKSKESFNDSEAHYV